MKTPKDLQKSVLQRVVGKVKGTLNTQPEQMPVVGPLIGKVNQTLGATAPGVSQVQNKLNSQIPGMGKVKKLLGTKGTQLPVVKPVVNAMKKNDTGIAAPKWMDKHPILDPEHIHDLETKAAINEFHHKMPRDQAELAAHADYVQEQLENSAAHHLMGVKASQAAGDMDAARKHGMMYSLVLKKLGHDPVGLPPPSVVNRTKNPEHSIYRFKPHKADMFLLDEKPDGEVSMSKADFERRLEVLMAASKVTLALHKLNNR